MVILSFCSAFAPQDVQTVNRSPSSCLPCSAMEEFHLLCNHLFRSQLSLLRSILVWLLLSFYARSSRNRSIGECTEVLPSSPLPTTLGYHPLLMTSVGAPESNLLWWLQVGDEEEALIKIWVFWAALAFLFSAMTMWIMVCRLHLYWAVSLVLLFGLEPC
ncbi:hypothetical protein RchiOBHm_Chr7g0239901 [Rosa chinensis]|uniref:Uncharacterized protein n=1 Tax=Rosa chinensis TaxID=74649 RepID=A0A2P6PHU5_ROSCH|nr:hypothetical protein RchiOBHm_Chr7g0239901 [Rosa chinensis]